MFEVMPPLALIAFSGCSGFTPKSRATALVFVNVPILTGELGPFLLMLVRMEVSDVLGTGIMMRYGFDGPRKGIWKTIELEKAICDRFGCQHAQLVSSGTAALTTAMAALGIGYGDEIILPCFTFVASFEAVLSVGAVPVFVDVDDTLTLDPEAVRKAITRKTKCVMPVHMCGSMSNQ